MSEILRLPDAPPPPPAGDYDLVAMLGGVTVESPLPPPPAPVPPADPAPAGGVTVRKVDAALAWAAKGYRIFPCHPDTPATVANGDVKKPIWKGWTDWASSDPAQIAAWWQDHEWNIGVLCDGMVVIDLDIKSGRDGMRSWLELHGDFDTLTVRTPSGGFHAYYVGANVAINQGALGRGLDVRSYHGYVLAPGSTVGGVPYTIEIDQPMAQVPPAVLARCKPPGEKKANAHATLVEEDTPLAIERAKAIVAKAPLVGEGELSDAAFKLACKVRDQGISETMCAEIMLPWGVLSGVVGGDLEYRIGNAYNYAQNPAGIRHPVVQWGGAIDVPPPSDEDVAAGQAKDTAKRAERSGLRLLSVAECAAAPPRSYVVKGLIAAGQLGGIIGEPGAGKSVIAPSIAYAAAQGRHTFGLRTKAGPVIYAACEDEAGMQQRIAALRKRHGDAPGFHLAIGIKSLMDHEGGDLARLQQMVEDLRPSLIIIDTFAAAFPGLRENEAESMGLAVAALRTLTRLGAAVVIVHHTPKGGGSPRGHGALNGALDMSVMVADSAEAQGVIEGQLQKNRNGPCTFALAFRIEAETFGVDADGDTITAPVCAELTVEAARAERKASLTQAQHAAEAILIDMGGKERGVPLAEWQLRCIEHGAISKAKRIEDRRTKFRQAKEVLLGKFRIDIRREGGEEVVRYMGTGYEHYGDTRCPPAPDALFPPGIVPLMPPPVVEKADILASFTSCVGAQNEANP